MSSQLSIMLPDGKSTAKETAQVRRLCPKCKVGTLDQRVPRPQYVKVLFFWLKLQRYQCYRCKKKSYVIS